MNNSFHSELILAVVLTATAIWGCSNECSYPSDEELCELAGDEDWEAVWDAIKDYIDEIHEYPECSVEHEDPDWNYPEFPEIPSSRAWLEEKDCVKPNDLAYIIYETNPAVAVYCLGFLVGAEYIYIEVSIRMDETLVGSVYTIEDMTCEEWWYPYLI